MFFSSRQLKSTGQDVLNRVAELLGIKELHFFGLTVVKGKLNPHSPPQPVNLVVIQHMYLYRVKKMVTLRLFKRFTSVALIDIVLGKHFYLLAVSLKQTVTLPSQSA